MATWSHIGKQQKR